MRVVKLGLVKLFAAVWAFHVSVSPALSGSDYSFGVVPQFEARKLAEIWVPILQELEKRTGYTFRMEGSPRIPEFEQGLGNGDFDFAYMNPYHAVIADAKQGYTPIIRDGGRELFGILVVSKDSPIKSVRDLDGKRISFPAPNALGASLLMRADLAMIHGIKFDPVYASTHTSSYLNAILGRTDAAGGVMGTFNRQKPEMKDNLRIIYETRRMPPHPIAAHPRVPAEVREAVQKAFLDMSVTDEGRALLSAVPIREAIAASKEDYGFLNAWGLENFYVKPGL